MWIAFSVIGLWEFFMCSHTIPLLKRRFANVSSHLMCSLFWFSMMLFKLQEMNFWKKSPFSLNIDMMLNWLIGGRNTLTTILRSFHINQWQDKNFMFSDSALVKDHRNDRHGILKYLAWVFISAIMHSDIFSFQLILSDNAYKNV